MKKLSWLFAFIVCISSYGVAQQVSSGALKGKVSDTANTSLQGATITIKKLVDSSTVSQALTHADGSFLITKLPFGTYRMEATFQGYTTLEKSFTITPTSPEYDAGTLKLGASADELETFVVRSSTSAAVKGDTTEFNASNIITKPNATAEDLLKKIPGVEVDKDGEIKAQGEAVARVMIDGKMFFGNDAKMATQNLPSDIIDKIQLIDAQSDQAAFTGFDDGIQEKVINIITKKNRRKGYFGKNNLSVGNDGRYGLNMNLNRFNGNRKISLIARGNNTNQENYTISEILEIINSGGLSGGNGGFAGFENMGQSGIARTYSGGLNYTDIIGTKTEVNGSYRYSNVNTLNQSSRLRETFVSGDSSLFNNNSRYGNNRNINHNVNLNVEHKFDSSNSIIVRSTYNTQRTNNYNESISYLTRGKQANQKDVRNITNSLTDGSNLNNNILFRHRFPKRGRTVSISLNQAMGKSETDRTAFNYTNNYLNGSGKIDTTNRISDINRKNESNNVKISYTEPITPKSNLELNYEFTKSLSLSDQKTNSYNPVTGLYDVVDTVLSNNFKNVNTAQRGGFNFRQQLSREWNYIVGLSVQQTEISSDNKTRQKYLSQTFNNFFPTATLQYRKGRNTSLRFNYRGSTRQPGITQLQDIVDNTNLLRITRGNPSLKQEFSNSFNLRYTKIDALNGKNLIVRVSGSKTDNKISNAVTINNTQAKVVVDNVELEPFAQYSKPVNISGAYNVQAYLNYGFQLKWLKSNMNLSTDLSHSRDVNLVNNVKGFTRNYSIGERVKFTTNFSERFDMNFSSSSTYHISSYSLRADQNGNYFRQVFSIEPTYNTKSGWIIGTDFDYNKTTGQAEGYNQTIPLWHASLSKQLFPKKQGEIKFSVFDILNENKSIVRNVEENYIEDVRTNVLQRYFLVSFIYNFRKFGS